MADVSFPRLEASCGHPLSARLTGTDVCTQCLPADSIFHPGLPRPLGEQLVEVTRAALETQAKIAPFPVAADWLDAAARNIATVLLAEFDIARRLIR